MRELAKLHTGGDLNECVNECVKKCVKKSFDIMASHSGLSWLPLRILSNSYTKSSD